MNNYKNLFSCSSIEIAKQNNSQTFDCICFTIKVDFFSFSLIEIKDSINSSLTELEIFASQVATTINKDIECLINKSLLGESKIKFPYQTLDIIDFSFTDGRIYSFQNDTGYFVGFNGDVSFDINSSYFEFEKQEVLYSIYSAISLQLTNDLLQEILKDVYKLPETLELTEAYTRDKKIKTIKVLLEF